MIEHSGTTRSTARLLLLALAACAGCKKAEDPVAAPVVAVQVAKPTVGPIVEELSADAILAPVAQAAIAPRISAPILREYVQRGQRVRQGQLLVTLDARDLSGAAADSKGAVDSAQAAYTTAVRATIPDDLKRAQTDLEQARALRDVAQRTAAERARLFKQGALAGRDADTAAAAAVQAEATFQVAQRHLESVTATTQLTSKQAAAGQLESARGKLQSAQAQVTYGQLKSPINGVVTERPLFPGETAVSGATVITVMDTSSLLAKLHLAQASAQKLHVGDKAEVNIPGIEAAREGVVSFISPALDAGSTTVEVWVKIGNAKGELKVGTPVHTVLSGNTINAALQVPLAAIVPAAEGGTAVILMQPDGTSHRAVVRVGIRTPEMVQVLSGLTQADNVVIEGGYGLEDGTRLKVGKPAAADADEAKP